MSASPRRRARRTSRSPRSTTSTPTGRTGPERLRDLRVLFFGDSFVAGVGDPQGLGWVGRTVADAWAGGLRLTAYNLGVRRQTSEEVVARMAAEARPRIAGEARVVLSFGANDATLKAGGVRVVPERTVAALRAALEVAERLGLPAFVVGPAPVADEAHADRIAALSTRLRDACPGPYVDVAGALRRGGPWMAEARAGDGAHPGAGGYAQLAALAGPPLLAWLRSATL